MVFEGTAFDNVVHVLTIIVAATLLAISIVSYIRNRRTKFLFICAAFLLFTIKELFILIEVFFYSNPFMIGFAHFLNLVILMFFFIGVTK